MFDPHQLAVIAEVARTGSYTAAAKTLGYTQPAVSYQMRMLERAAGVPLVTKAGRGVRLTAAGHALVRHGEVVLEALRTAENEMAALSAAGGGKVRLAAIQSGCVSLVPAALGALRRTHPDVEVVVTQAECPTSHRMVLAGDVEIALMCEVDNDRVEHGKVQLDHRLRRTGITTDCRNVLLPSDHPQAARNTVQLADLADERWVLETSRSRFLAACKTAGFTPLIAATADDQLTTHCLVAQGFGLGVINGLGLVPHRDPRVVARPLSGWPDRRIFTLAWPEMVRVPAVSALLTALHSVANAGMHAKNDLPEAGRAAKSQLRS